MVATWPRHGKASRREGGVILPNMMRWLLEVQIGGVVIHAVEHCNNADSRETSDCLLVYRSRLRLWTTCCWQGQVGDRLVLAAGRSRCGARMRFDMLGTGPVRMALALLGCTLPRTH